MAHMDELDRLRANLERVTKERDTFEELNRVNFKDAKHHLDRVTALEGLLREVREGNRTGMPTVRWDDLGARIDAALKEGA